MARNGIEVRLPHHGENVAQIALFANECRPACRSLRLAGCTGARTAPDFLLTTATARRICNLRCQGGELGLECGLLQGQ